MSTLLKLFPTQLNKNGTHKEVMCPSLRERGHLRTCSMSGEIIYKLPSSFGENKELILENIILVFCKNFAFET